MGHTNRRFWVDLCLGDSVEDTYFAVKSVVFELLKQNVIPVILGGSQDLSYAQYRAYDDYGSMVNYVNVDSRFDLGNTEEAITPTSFVGKILQLMSLIICLIIQT